MTVSIRAKGKRVFIWNGRVKKSKGIRYPATELVILFSSCFHRPFPLFIKGHRRLTRKLFFSVLIALVILSILNASSLVAAQVSDDDDGDDSESFLDHDEMEPDPTLVTHPALPPSIPSPPPSPAPAPDVPTALAAPAPPPSPSPPPPSTSTSHAPAPLPTAPSGILKAGTPSADCAIFGQLYQATGPWQFVPDPANCCNAEYPNSSGVKCNPAGQIIYIYLAGTSVDDASTKEKENATINSTLFFSALGQGLSGSLPDSLGSLPA